MSLISVYLLWSEVLEWWQIKLHRWEFLVQKKFKLAEFLGGDSHAKEKGYRSYLNKQFWYLLSVKPQKVPFWVLSPKDMTGDDDYVLCKNWYLFKPRPQSRILVRLRGSFQISDEHPHSFIYESLPPSRGGIGHFRVPLRLCFKASLSAKPF